MMDRLTEITDPVDLELRATKWFWEQRIEKFGVESSLAPVTPVPERQRAALFQLLTIPHIVRLSKKTLEIGCGPGRLPWIPSMCASYVGVDFMPEYIATAKRRSPGYDYQVADVRKLPFGDGAFDLVIGVEVGSSLAWKYEEEVLPEIQRVLSENGLFILAENDFVRFQWKHE